MTRLDVAFLHVLLLGLAAAGVAFDYGFRHPPIESPLNQMLQVSLFMVYLLDTWIGSRRGRTVLPGHQAGWLEASLHVVGIASALGAAGGWGTWIFFETIVVVTLVAELWRLNVALSHWLRRPGLLLPITFLTLIAVGTLLIKLPMATPPGQGISWLDALFTMTSAACVTGLTVRDTGAGFTPLGQTFILIVIQLGGLGITIFGTMLALVFGSRLSLREDVNLSEVLNDAPLSQTLQLVRFIVLTTIGLELLGALVMTSMWQGDMELGQRLAHSIFHSVSAFCNAGFALYPDSLVSYRYSLLSHVVIAPLIVLGGLGFPVLYDAWQASRWRATCWWRRVRRQAAPVPRSLARTRLTLNSKIVLLATLTLYLLGVAILFAGQLAFAVHEDEQVQVGRLLADSSFMSITARTAGFNTVPMDELGPASVFGLTMLMMVGGAPGGTAGGMKVTVIALLILSIVTSMRRQQHAELFHRRIGSDLLGKAGTFAAAYVLVVCGITLLLCFSEQFTFVALLFEAVSATTVTGLSLGITGDLSAFGRVVVIVAMFIGRIGPLSLFAGIMFGNRPTHRYSLPHEPVLMG